MKTTLTVRGRVTLTYLRDGSIRIEAAGPIRRQRRSSLGDLLAGPRLHVRGDEFLRLIHEAARAPRRAPLPGEERFGAL